MTLTKRKDGRWCKSKTYDGYRVFFYSSEESEKKAGKDIENQMIKYSGRKQKGAFFKDVAAEWEEQHYKTIRYQTMRRYKSLTSRLVKYFGDCYIKEILPKDICEFLNKMVYDGFSTKTIRDESSVLKMIFKFAVINKYLTENITLYVSNPKGKPKKERQPLTNEEIKIVEYNIDKEFGLLAYFLLYTGLRKSEALALTYGDIDKENSLISVTKAVEYIENEPNIKETKTAAGTRFVPLPDKLKEKLPWGEKEDIIFNQKGKLMTASYFNKHWKKYKKEIGLNITAHQLRHTFTTLLFEWNINEKDSQGILGHSDISVTRNIYTHIRKNRMEETIQKINQMLSD